MKIKMSVFVLLTAGTLHATTLKEAVEAGLNYDPEIMVEEKKYEIKDKSVSLVEADYLPKVDIYGGIGYEETDREKLHSAQLNESFTREEASARLRQPIFEGYKTTYGVSAASADRDATAYDLDALKGNKALKIVQAYLNVLKMQQINSLAQGNLDTHKKIFNSIKEKYGQGVSSKADLVQIQGRVVSAKANLISSKNNLLDAQAVYYSVTGQMPKSLQNISAREVRIPSSLQEAIDLSTTSHPTLLSTQTSVKKYENRRDATKSGFYPHIYGDLSANYEKDAGGIEGPQETYQAMVRLEWNIFNGQKDQKQYEISQIEVLQASNQSEDAVRQLELETRLSWNAYISIKNQLEPLKEHVKYAKESTKLYSEQYNVNRRSLLDVLNAQVEYFTANRELVKARYDEIAAKYRVLNSVGTLNNHLGVSK